jgi:hypothetical protein
MISGLFALYAHQSLQVPSTVSGIFTSSPPKRSGPSMIWMAIPRLRCHAMWQWKLCGSC